MQDERWSRFKLLLPYEPHLHWQDSFRSIQEASPVHQSSYQSTEMQEAGQNCYLGNLARCSLSQAAVQSISEELSVMTEVEKDRFETAMFFKTHPD